MPFEVTIVWDQWDFLFYISWACLACLLWAREISITHRLQAVVECYKVKVKQQEDSINFLLRKGKDD